MKKNSILVTGASGFVGSHLVRRLVKENKNVTIFVRKTSDLKRIKDIYSFLSIIEADLLDKEKLYKIVTEIRPKIIFHLANIGLYGGQEPSSKDVINVNLLGTTNLVEACDLIDYTHFINTGSSSEYGPKTASMSEDDSCNPKSLYAITKLAATLFCKSYGEKSRKPILTLRLFSPFGPYDEPLRLISSTIKNIYDGKRLVFASKHAVRDFIFINDVIDAYISCLSAKNFTYGDIINIGSGKETSVKECVQTILGVMGKNIQVTWDAVSPRMYESSVWKANIKKAKRVLGWEPKTSFKDGIKKTVEWYSV